MLNTGSMFVHVEGMEQQVYIHSRNSLNALDGDRVQLVLTRKARGSNAPEGEITAIVERSRKRYVGTAEVNEHNVFVRIDSRKMPVDVYLHKRDCPNVKNGDKVVVRIAEWAPGSKSPVGELVDILGKAGENDTEMHAHSRRIRPPLPLRAGGRGGSRSHRRAHHPQRLRRAARLPADGDLHRRSGRRQGLRRRAVGPPKSATACGRWASISPT